MDDRHPLRPLMQWRDTRRRRALDSEALRAEFELDPRPRGLAALRAFAASIAELERARLRSHESAARLSSAPADVTADRRRATSR